MQIGYIGADRAAWIRGKLDRGYDVAANIDRLLGGAGLEQPIGAVLAVTLS